MKRHFTIIELISVMVIAGLMMSVAMPAFSKMIKGSGPGLAAREIMGKIGAARAYAIANQVDVAIVFPIANGITDDAKFKYSAYRVAEVYCTAANAFSLKKWVDDWNFLPTGVVIGRKNGSDDFFAVPDTYDSNSSNNKENKVASEPSQTAYEMSGFLKPNSTNDSYGSRELNAIVIRKDGMLYNMQPMLIRIREGVYNGSTINVPSDDYLPLVVRFSGKCKFYNELVTP